MTRLWLALWWLVPAWGFAEAPPLVVLRSVKPAAPALEASLSEMLGRLGAQLTGAPPSDGSEPLAIVEIDLTSGQVLVDSPSRKITIRRLVPAELGGEVRSETAASLVSNAVEVLLHTDPPRQPVKIDAPPPEPPPPPPRRSAIGLDLGVGLGAKLTGGQSLLDFGASVHALLGIPLGTQLPGVMAWVGFQPGLELGDDAVSLRGSVFSARLFLQLEVLRWQYGRLEAGAGAGIDRFAFDRLQREGELFRPGASRVAVAPIIAGLVTYRFPIGETVHLFASVTVDGDLREPVVPPAMRRPGDDVDPRPWTVRPTLQLGVSFAPLRAR